MSHFRRQDDRRRRVLMTTAAATSASPTSASRSRIESLREARHPTLVYGTRVDEALQGRWFSLVPVERSTLAKLLSALALSVLTVVLLNDATVRFAAIESRPEFVNVLQIHRLGSLGRYVIGVMYLALAGAAWMVYQLRRFRNDDFRGDYRLWQWVVGVALSASLATMVPVLAMFGGAVESLLGRRIALSGHDWIGLFLVVGGAILALRTIAEMWRYRASMTLLIAGWLWAAIPVAAQWNVIVVDSNLKWSIVTSGSLVSVSLWLAASVCYLRSLYHEVRGIEPSMGIVERIRSVSLPGINWRKSESRGDSSDSDAPQPRKPTTKPVAAKPATAQAKPSEPEFNQTPAKPTKSTDSDADQQTDSGSPSPKRRLFGLLPPAKAKSAKPKPKPTKTKNVKPKSAQVSDHESSESEPTPSKQSAARSTASPDRGEDSADGEENPKPKRKWWPGRGAKPSPDPAADVPAKSAADPPREEPSPTDDEAPKKRRFGLGSMMKRKKQAETDDDEPETQPTQPAGNRAASKSNSANAAEQPADDDDDQDESAISEDDIDWSGMNKAERRRMRKQLKRSGRAA
ncbi:hypothetical protein [Allorhodopirellula solitaria]|uniref:Uncharacterized protein n=1 Tax=Allorhodopirellula solitaria TaxID=2527987 RepID=A0A5C5YJR5_9BACT|nr:hypothetical protein [Allorhodopirellula solitaria]TWT75136.1 hypothetical protein CA85_04250 [Allorhodopirellula solitaria]